MLSNSARNNQKITSTPDALVISSTTGAEMGAASIIAASWPRSSVMAGCWATQASINAKKAVLNGKASAVAMHPPHKKAAANNHGVSRSRRSRNQNTASGTTARRLESVSALTNTPAMSGPMLARTLSWISVVNASNARSAALSTLHTPRRRSGESRSEEDRSRDQSALPFFCRPPHNHAPDFQEVDCRHVLIGRVLGFPRNSAKFLSE